MWDSVYIVGDSFAEGVDVDPKDSLGSRIAEHYNVPLINKGYAGASNEYTFRTLYEDVPKFDIKPLVVLVYTNSDRQDFYINNHNIIGSVITRPNMFSKSFIKEYLTNCFSEEYQVKKSLSYIKAIRLLLETNSIPYIECFSMHDPILFDSFLKQEYTYAKLDDVTHMMDTSLTVKGGWNKFHLTVQPKNELPAGHLNERGSELVAQWMIEKINSLYPNEYANKPFVEKYT